MSLTRTFDYPDLVYELSYQALLQCCEGDIDNALMTADEAVNVAERAASSDSPT